MKFSVGRFLFAAMATLLLVGALTYLHLAFEGADVKTAIRLVEEAPVDGTVLGQRLDGVIPRDQRLCEATVLSRLRGNMEVRCTDVQRPEHVLYWHVNLFDGLVQPVNEAAKRVGKGENPWAKINP